MHLRLAVALTLGLTAWAAVPAFAEQDADRDAPAKRGAPVRYAVPGGKVEISPSVLPAAESGQEIHFSVSSGLPLVVELPRAWVDVPPSGIHPSRTDGHRSGRLVDVTGGGFDVTDVGIPAGDYALPLFLRGSGGRLRRVGTGHVTFAPAEREAAPNVFTDLIANGIARNATDDTNEESETYIAAQEGNANRVAVAVNWQSPSMSAWISNDGGDNWTLRTLPQTLDKPGSSSTESGNVCCDPMAAADTLGNIWIGSLTLAHGSVPSRIVVNRIAAGTTAMQPLTTGLPITPGTDQDKPMMTIDNSASSPTFGRIYIVWNQDTSSNQVAISSCDTRPGGVSNPANCDNADNWTQPVAVSVAGSVIYADVAVGPDGKVYVTWQDFSATNAIQGEVCTPSVSNANCTNSSSFSGASTTIALLDNTGNKPIPFRCPILAQPGGRDAPAPAVAVDHSGGAGNGKVYVKWGDFRAGRGTTRCTSNGASALTHLTCGVFLAAATSALPGGSENSTSAGTKLYDDGATNSDEWFSDVAVDQSSGDVWADFYSTRDDSTREKTNFYARKVATAGGAISLGTLQKVSSGQSDYSNNACCNFGNDYGDYEGIAASNGVAYPVWTDTSSGTHDGEAFTFAARTAPHVATGSFSGVTSSGATVAGTINPRNQAADYHFEYGTDTSYGTSTSSGNLGADDSTSSVNAGITGLAAGTTYHYKLVAHNSTGTTSGGDRMFTTSGTPPPPGPVITTGSATGVDQTTATLNGTINPNGQSVTYHFAYGTTTGYGATAPTPFPPPLTGSTTQPVSAGISGLSAGTTYHYALVGSPGGTGADRTFTTASPPPPP